MKLIESSVELLKQEPGIVGINKMIELAGRTCYKSEANITENSAEEFVKRMVNSRHMAMLEHGTIYLDFGWLPWDGTTYELVSKYIINKYSKVCGPIYGDVQYMEDERQYSKCFVTTNLRVLQENGWLDDLKYLCEPTEFHEKRITIKFIPNIAIAREIRTHRKMSFANESTRWCNYSKDRFDNNITFIRPVWLKTSDYNIMDDIGRIFYRSCEHCEYDYMRLLKKGLKPEDARDSINLDVKSEIVVTGFASDWREFFDKRLFEKTGRVHPMMLKLATEAKQLLFKEDLWGYIISFPSKFD